MSETSYPTIAVENIKKLGISFQSGVAKVKFEVENIGPDLLRLIYLQTTGQPINVTFASPQAVMDLHLNPVDLKTGEVKD